MRGGVAWVVIHSRVCLTLGSVLRPLRTSQGPSPRQHSASHRGLVCGLNHKNTANNSNNCCL